MSTTLELPDDVMREVELHAARAGSKPGEFVASVLRQQLHVPVPKALPSIKARPLGPETADAPAGGRLETNPETGLPVIRCVANAPARTMTAAQLIALEHETLMHEDLERLGLPH